MRAGCIRHDSQHHFLILCFHLGITISLSYSVPKFSVMKTFCILPLLIIVAVQATGLVDAEGEPESSSQWLDLIVQIGFRCGALFGDKQQFAWTCLTWAMDALHLTNGSNLSSKSEMILMASRNEAFRPWYSLMTSVKPFSDPNSGDTESNDKSSFKCMATKKNYGELGATYYCIVWPSGEATKVLFQSEENEATCFVLRLAWNTFFTYHPTPFCRHLMALPFCCLQGYTNVQKRFVPNSTAGTQQLASSH